MASFVKDNGVNGISFGTDISKLLPEGAKAMTYSDEYSIDLPDISGGYKWTLKITANTSGPIASPEYTTKTETYGYYSFSHLAISGYKFNNATVTSFSIIAKSQKEFIEEASTAIIAILKQHGFKDYNPDTYESEFIAVLKKGDIVANVNYYGDDSDGLILHVYQDDDVTAVTETPSDSAVVDTLAN